MSATAPCPTDSAPRLDGLDFARFIAFTGMVLVNFKLVVSGDTAGSTGLLDQLLTLLEGRAAATFVVLAGIGLGLAGLRGNLDATISVTLKRALFLLAIGLANMLVFDADILHYYAFYFLFGALLLPLASPALIVCIVGLNLLSVVLILTLNYEAGWNWTEQSYSGFWTVEGFIRNLFFNGWHPVVPWLAFLLFGMLLARTALAARAVQWWLCLGGAVAITLAELGSALLSPWLAAIDPELLDLATTSPLPPMPLYLLAGMGSASLLIGSCLLLRNRLARSGLLTLFIPAGRQTLTLYIAHILLGMLVLDSLGLTDDQPVWLATLAALLFCSLAVLYAHLWSRYFKRGPLETLMRKLAG